MAVHGVYRTCVIRRDRVADIGNVSCDGGDINFAGKLPSATARVLDRFYRGGRMQYVAVKMVPPKSDYCHAWREITSRGHMVPRIQCVPAWHPLAMDSL